MEQEVVLKNASVVREGFQSTEMAIQNEVSSSAVAAQMRAMIEARYVMALRRPREWDDVRAKLLKESQRPGFAQSAIYHKPVGKGVEGLSIRFAEAALRCMGNAADEVFVLWDDPEKRIVRVCITDLENNVPHSKDIVVDKTVERSKVPDGTTPLRVRQNSSGKLTYLLPATEDDLLPKENALCSKARRNLILAVLPGDIQDECKALLYKIRADRAAKDPDGEKKQLLDYFAALNVMPSMLAEFLGHSLDTIVPAELVELRAIYVGLKEGEANWNDVMALRQEQRAAKDGDQSKMPPPASPATEKLKDRIEKRRAKEAAKAAAPAAAEASETKAPAPETPPATSAPAPRPPAPAATPAKQPSPASPGTPSPSGPPAPQKTREELDEEDYRAALKAEQATEEEWG